MKPEAKRSFPPPMDPLSISRLFHQRALLKRATRVLYVCFSFPVEKSLIIGNGNAKWADQRDIPLSTVYITPSHNRLIPSSFPFQLKTSLFFYDDGHYIGLNKKRGRRKKKGERNHEDSLSGANNAVPRFPQEYFITEATVTAIINGYSRE